MIDEVMFFRHEQNAFRPVHDAYPDIRNPTFARRIGQEAFQPTCNVFCGIRNPVLRLSGRVKRFPSGV